MPRSMIVGLILTAVMLPAQLHAEQGMLNCNITTKKTLIEGHEETAENSDALVYEFDEEKRTLSRQGLDCKNTEIADKEIAGTCGVSRDVIDRKTGHLHRRWHIRRRVRSGGYPGSEWRPGTVNAYGTCEIQQPRTGKK